MKVRFYRWYNAVLTALLSMLGYGCSSSDLPPAEYGAPNADYVVKGTITDEDGTPVQGIKAVLKEMPDEYPEYSYGIDSTLTDAAGKYQITHNYYRSEGMKLIVKDTDGEANGGEYKSDTIDISKLEAKEIGGGDGHWYRGKYEINADVKLKRKQDESHPTEP